MAGDSDKVKQLGKKLAYAILAKNEFCCCMSNIDVLAGRIMGVARSIDHLAGWLPGFIVAEWGTQLMEVYTEANWDVLRIGLHPKVMDPTGVQHKQEDLLDGYPN